MLTWMNPPEDQALQNILSTTHNDGVTFHLSTPIEYEKGYRIDDKYKLRTAKKGEDGYTLQKTSWSANTAQINEPIDILIKKNIAFGTPFPKKKGTHPCLFLDRDGILIEDTGYPHKPKELHLITDAIPLIQTAQEKNYKVIIVTNQAGLAKEIFNEEQYRIFTKAIEEKLLNFSIRLDGIYYCPWHKKGSLFKKDSLFRKPHPGMLLQACDDHDINLSQSFMVGDKDSDNIQIPELKSFIYQGNYPLQSPQHLQVQNLQEVAKHL
ncbi:MAG: D-glycero-alpha-D-manno-heptose-1,7-bisphosphate 7-phosphatase [Oligoflexales bacterium]